MKLVLALAIATIVTACGSAGSSSSTQSVEDSSKTTAERVLLPLTGDIGNVVVKTADAPALGIWTEVEVGFTVSCMHRLESVAVSYDQNSANGKTRILTSAFISARKAPHNGPVCLGISHHTETVTMPGVVDASELELVALNAKKADIPLSTADIISATDVKVLGTRSLCPPNAICKLDGTVVTLSVEKGSCVNTLAPLAINAVQNDLNSDINLTVHGVVLVDKRAPFVRCSTVSERVEISLPNIYGDVKDVKLNVLQ